MKFLNNLISDLENDPKQLMNGCSDNEIDAVSKILNIKFPEAYIEFLTQMGKHVNFLKEDYCFIDDIILLNKTSRETIKKVNQNYNKHFVLDEMDFVFWQDNQAVIFTYFNLLEGNDPPVYGFSEGLEKDTPIQVSDSISSFLRRLYEKDLSLFNEIFSDDFSNNVDKNETDEMRSHFFENGLDDELPF